MARGFKRHNCMDLFKKFEYVLLSMRAEPGFWIEQKPEGYYRVLTTYILAT